MYKPSTYLIVTYFPTYLTIYETYFLQNRWPRWNQILTHLKFIEGEKSIMDVLENMMVALTDIAFFKTPHVTLCLVRCLIVELSI
jgi:hypothetical protein